MHEGHDFVPLLIVTGISLLTVFVSLKIRVMRIPIVVGEILMGMLLGHSGLRIIPEEPGPWLSFLSLFGFTMLMFLSGLEIDFEAVRRNLPGRRFRDVMGDRLGLAILIFLGSLSLSFIFSLLLVLVGVVESPWVMALILSTTSVGIVVPLLKERGSLNSNFGQVLILAAVVADFATMFLITVVVAIHIKGGLTVDVAVIASVFAAFFAFVTVGRKLKAGPTIRRVFREGATATAQIRVRSAMTVMLFFIVLSQFTGTEIILGAFLAGAVVSLLTTPGGGRLGNKLDAIGYGFLIPYFFIMVGAKFSLSELLSSPTMLLLAPALLVIAFVVKVVPALLLKSMFGRRQAIAGGILLSSRLSLVIAAAAIGVEMGAISPGVNSAIILMAVVTCLFSPLLFNKLMGQAETHSDAPADLEPLIGHLVNNPEGLHLKLAQVPLAGKPSLIGHTLAQTELRSRTGVTVIALARGDGLLIENPPADAVLAADDCLIVIGETKQIQTLQHLDAPKLQQALPLG